MIETIALEKKLTAEEYLEKERKNLREFGGKHEFFNQQLIEMAGGSIPHSGIESNLSYVFQSQARMHKTKHLVLSSNAKVISFLRYKNYLYPDLVVVEGRAFHADDNDDIVMNPSILVEVLSESTELRDKLQANTQFFRTELSKIGLEILAGEHPIVPVMFGDAIPAVKMAESLLQKGIYVIPFSFPVVPKGKARIRTQVSAAHSLEDLQFAVEKFAEAKQELGI